VVRELTRSLRPAAFHNDWSPARGTRSFWRPSNLVVPSAPSHIELVSLLAPEFRVGMHTLGISVSSDPGKDLFPSRRNVYRSNEALVCITVSVHRKSEASHLQVKPYLC